MRAGLLLLLSFFFFSLRAQIPVIGADSLLKHYSAKIKFLDRDTALGDFYSMDLHGISIFADATQKKNNLPEYKVNWSDLSLYKNIIGSVPREEAMQIMLDKGNRPFLPAFVKRFSLPPEILKPQPTNSAPLKGLRIAIDPGHIASDTAAGRMEDKFLLFKTISGKDSVTISLAEGMLTWNTANALANLLRADGAEVLMTRKRAELTAFGKTYVQWKMQDYQRTLDSLYFLDPADVQLRRIRSGKLRDENSIFRNVFRDAELRKRAEIINAFHPDLTVIIHFNVDEKNKPWSHPSTKDYCMTFVPGSFQQGELGDPERRFDFLRLLLLDDIENSTKIAGLTALELKSELDIPMAKPTDATYLNEHCLEAGLPGVYCRNLSLTRLIEGTLVYGESLYQDNANECLLLTKKQPLRAEGPQSLTGNERLDEVAGAYHKAILLWAKNK